MYLLEPNDIKARIRSEVPKVNLYEALTGTKMKEPYTSNCVRQALQTIQDNRRMTEIRNLDEFNSFTEMYNRLILRSTASAPTTTLKPNRPALSDVNSKKCPLCAAANHTLKECKQRCLAHGDKIVHHKTTDCRL